MKKMIALLCALLICLCALCGCGNDAPAETGQPGAPAANDQADDSTDYPVQEQEEIDRVDTPASITLSAGEISGTYWRAVRFEGEGSAEGGDEMPIGSRNVDLFLNDDGTGRLRSTYGASYDSFQPECSWSYDEGTARLVLETSDGMASFGGVFTESGLCIDYNGGKLWLEQAEMPTAGGQWCLADLVGTWKLETMEIEGYALTAEEAGAHGSVSFFFLDPELNANYVQYDDFGNRTEIVDAKVVYLDMPLFDGCANQSWCVELIGDDDSVKCYAALLDRDTMVMMVEYYDEGFEYPAVSIQHFGWEGAGAVG